MKRLQWALAHVVSDIASKKTRKQMLKPLHFQCLSFHLTSLHSWVPLCPFLAHIWFTHVWLLQGARSWWCSTNAMIAKSRSPSFRASSSYWLLTCLKSQDKFEWRFSLFRLCHHYWSGMDLMNIRNTWRSENENLLIICCWDVGRENKGILLVPHPTIPLTSSSHVRRNWSYNWFRLSFLGPCLSLGLLS